MDQYIWQSNEKLIVRSEYLKSQAEYWEVDQKYSNMDCGGSSRMPIHKLNRPYIDLPDDVFKTLSNIIILFFLNIIINIILIYIYLYRIKIICFFN